MVLRTRGFPGRMVAGTGLDDPDDTIATPLRIGRERWHAPRRR
ncbi:hypothetical protein [Sphingomonas sp. PAMC 26621]|nr:hypothetical protein [Sphingomonas sp. PAMC 26621]